MRKTLGCTQCVLRFFLPLHAECRSRCCRAVCFQKSNADDFRYGKCSTVYVRKRTDTNVRRFSFSHSSVAHDKICVIFVYYSKQ